MHTGEPQLATQCSAPVPASVSSTQVGMAGQGALMHCTCTTSQCLPITHARLHAPPVVPPVPPPVPASARSSGHTKPVNMPPLHAAVPHLPSAHTRQSVGMARFGGQVEPPPGVPP